MGYKMNMLIFFILVSIFLQIVNGINQSQNVIYDIGTTFVNNLFSVTGELFLNISNSLYILATMISPILHYGAGV